MNLSIHINTTNQYSQFKFDQNRIKKNAKQKFVTHTTPILNSAYKALRFLSAPAAQFGKDISSLFNRAQRKHFRQAGGGDASNSDQKIRSTWQKIRLCFKKIIKIIPKIGYILLQIFSLLVSPIVGIARAGMTLAKNKMSFIDYSEYNIGKQLNFEKESDLTSPPKIRIFNWNVGLMPGFISEFNDLRTSEKRAKEIANFFVKWESKKEGIDQGDSPDVICLQEVFDIDSTKILCKTLKHTYPYIIHSVAPNSTGLGSGLFFASKFPINEAQFQRFSNRKGEDTLAHKGMLSAEITLGEKDGKKVTTTIHSMHLQAKEDKATSQDKTYADIRTKQLLEAHRWIKEIKASTKTANNEKISVGNICNGDLNVSLMTDTGNNPMNDTPVDNLNPNNSYGEYKKNKLFFDCYEDPFLKNHYLNGKRRENAERTEPLVKRKGEEELHGTWTKGINLVDVKENANLKYGEKNWKLQVKDNVRLDYCLVLKDDENQSENEAPYQGQNQTRTMKYEVVDAQIINPEAIIPIHCSGQSDHLPLLTELNII